MDPNETSDTNDALDEILFSEESMQGMAFAPLDDQEGLLGRILKRKDKRHRARGIRKLFKRQVQSGTLLNSRDQAMQRMGGLPREIQRQLIRKTAQLADSSYYWIKPAGSATTIRMIVSDDNKGIGFSNVAKAQLLKDHYFLVDTIIVLAGVNAVPASTAFSIIGSNIGNGEIQFQADGNKYLVPKDTSCEVFKQPNRSNTMIGAWKLANPKWIAPQQEMTFDIRLPAALVANTNIKLMLNGTSVIQY